MASVFFIGTSTDRKDYCCIERLAGLYQSAGRKTSHDLKIERAPRFLMIGEICFHVQKRKIERRLVLQIKMGIAGPVSIRLERLSGIRARFDLSRQFIDDLVPFW
jgi:hypothetical protein